MLRHVSRDDVTMGSGVGFLRKNTIASQRQLFGNEPAGHVNFREPSLHIVLRHLLALSRVATQSILLSVEATVEATAVLPELTSSESYPAAKGRKMFGVRNIVFPSFHEKGTTCLNMTIGRNGTTCTFVENEVAIAF